MGKGKLWFKAFSSLLVVGLLVRVVTGNLTPNIRVPPPPPLPSPNAFDTYRAAMKSLARQNDVGNSGLDAQGKPREQVAWVKRADVLAANRDALRLVRTGLTQTYYQPPQRDAVGDFPYLKGYRGIARTLALDANSRFAKGDVAGGAAVSLEGVAFGQQVARGGSLVPRLVSVACQAITRRPLWLNFNRLDAPAARSSARLLEDLVARRVPLADTLTEEKYVLQTSLADIWSGEYFRNHPPPPSDETNDEDHKEEDNRLPPGFLYAIQPKRQTYDNLTRYMDALIALSRKPYAKRNPAPAFPGEMLNAILLPAGDTAFFKQTASEETQTALLIAALALRAYRVEHGAYPVDLQTLVTNGSLRRVPTDPFARNGAPLLYKRAANNGAGTLYSVGPDGDDDNGKAIYDLTRQQRARYQVLPESRGDIVAGVNDY